jgi:hypothetical protein
VIDPHLTQTDTTDGGFEDSPFTEWEKDVIPTDAEGIEDEDMM